ncbi:MAG: GNAT family N-acetyltransferase [Chloroflexota bacterium]
MQQWVVEHGTLWALETGDGLPPACSARVETVFKELEAGELDDLTAAMSLPSSELIHRRLEGNRRCFILKIDGRLATYGWVTHGVETVGELEREFHFRDDETYIWDCVTLPAYQRQRCYSALLSHIIYRLHHEGVPRIWIGASVPNDPSVRGFANAGFQPVIDLTYRRFYRLTILWFQQAPAAFPHLVSAAYRILVNNHEQRLGRLAIGYKQIPLHLG